MSGGRVTATVSQGRQIRNACEWIAPGSAPATKAQAVRSDAPNRAPRGSRATGGRPASASRTPRGAAGRGRRRRPTRHARRAGSRAPGGGPWQGAGPRHAHHVCDAACVIVPRDADCPRRVLSVPLAWPRTIARPASSPAWPPPNPSLRVRRRASAWRCRSSSRATRLQPCVPGRLAHCRPPRLRSEPPARGRSPLLDLAGTTIRAKQAGALFEP